MSEEPPRHEPFYDGPLTSRAMAEFIVDGLFIAGVVKKADVPLAIDIVAEELDVQRAGDEVVAADGGTCW